MDDLIEALWIFRRYADPKQSKWPTSCEHDVLFMCCVDPATVEPHDDRRLEELGWILDADLGVYKSHRYGSC